MLWRLASAWGDSPAKNSWTTCRLNSIECMRCLAMGFLLESPGQLADSQVPYLSTPRGALQWAVNFWQLIVKPSVETTSELQITSILGPLPKNIHRNVTRSAKPSVWSVCICVKNTAFNCSGDMPSSARRIVVPRPLSNCNFTAEQLLASSP